jgi:hypothetical protein
VALKRNVPSYSASLPVGRGRKRRPFGLKAIITLQIVQAILGVALFVLFNINNPDLQADLERDVRELLRLPLTLYLIFAILRIPAAIGLWRYQRWAWVLTMTLITVSMALDIVAFFRGRPLYLSMFLNVIMVFYLNLQEVQELFSGMGTETAG